MKILPKKYYPVVSYTTFILAGIFGGYATYCNFIRKDKPDRFERGKK